MTTVYKNNLNKIRKSKILDEYCGYLGPNNYVSMRKQGTCCIAPKLYGHTLRGPKLREAQLEGSKTLRGKFAFTLCPAEFWTPQSVPRGVLDPSKCAPRSFGAMQCVPRFLMET